MVTPISAVTGCCGILNVKREGTGSSIVWPVAFIHSNCADLGYPHEAIQRKSDVNTRPSFNSTLYKPEALLIRFTSACNSISTLYLFSSLIWQSMIVWEESVTG